MVEKKHTILIADDEEINREVLKKILRPYYNILEATDGMEVLEHLTEEHEEIACIILDLIMPNISGMDILRIYSKSQKLKDIPLIVSTGDKADQNELFSLRYGAWDFIMKPYQSEVVQFRVRNAIDRSNLRLKRKLQYMQRFDELTGIYKKEEFVVETQRMLEENPHQQYMLIYFDVDKFSNFNSIFGIKEGDRALCYIAKMLQRHAMKYQTITYGRDKADVFLVCQPMEDEEDLQKLCNNFTSELQRYKKNYDMLFNFGLYFITDNQISVAKMIDRAKLAFRVSKKDYMHNYGIYTDQLEEKVLWEQSIENDMRKALEREEFKLFMQPKYEIRHNTISGAEVLVRWQKSDGSMVSPGMFIPVFEKNGFIMELDYYIWEHSCKILREWIDAGKEPYPISVNISRISIYNPRMVEQICGLAEKYRIPPHLFQLELTESAYTDNQVAVKEAMEELQRRGFYVLMDDFGSGYSSLNVLKDIIVDCLKIDMKFMEKSEYPKRSENILAAVIKMAKCLEMPVVAEGAETEEQVQFLREQGCEYVQGFYFARPMPWKEYEELVEKEKKEKELVVTGP